MPPTFEHGAFRYLDQWLTTERHLAKKLVSKARSTRLEGVAEAVAFFGVARSLPVGHEERAGVARFVPLLEELEACCVVPGPELDFVAATEDLAAALGRRYGHRKLLSLASKLLWLKYRDPFIVYDSRTSSELGHPSTYALFADAWHARYQIHAAQVASACAKLPSVREFLGAADRTTGPEIAQLAAWPWFQHRCFDIYLWCCGGEGRSRPSASPPNGGLERARVE